MPRGAALAGFLLTRRRRSPARRRGCATAIDRLIGEGGLRAGVPRDAARALPLGSRDGLHQGERAHRRMDPRGLLRAASGRASAGDPRLRRVSADAARTAACSTAWRSSTRAMATCARSCDRTGKGWTETAARREIAGILQVLGKLHRGQMLHRDLTPMNVFVCEGRQLEARRLRDRPAPERPAGNPRGHAEPADRPERNPRRRRAEVAGAGRRLSGGAAPGDAREGGRAGADPHARDPEASPAAIT